MSIRTKLSCAVRRVHDPRELAAAELRVELQAERGQLDRDVGVEAARRDPVERAQIFRDRLLRLVRRVDVLAQDVDVAMHPSAFRRRTVSRACSSVSPAT